LARVERIRARTGESRSAVISRALARLTADEIQTLKTKRYEEVYREFPESAEEVSAARASAKHALRSVVWDDALECSPRRR
jgi:hypothetical protein